jgi:hypothetical protein
MSSIYGYRQMFDLFPGRSFATVSVEFNSPFFIPFVNSLFLSIPVMVLVVVVLGGLW